MVDFRYIVTVIEMENIGICDDFMDLGTTSRLEGSVGRRRSLLR